MQRQDWTVQLATVSPQAEIEQKLVQRHKVVNANQDTAVVKQWTNTHSNKILTRSLMKC